MLRTEVISVTAPEEREDSATALDDALHAALDELMGRAMREEIGEVTRPLPPIAQALAVPNAIPIKTAVVPPPIPQNRQGLGLRFPASLWRLACAPP